MKPIKISPEMKQQLLSNFEKYLDSERMTDNSISFSTTLINALPDNIQKPIIQFTPEAYVKMKTIIKEISSEVGWHGTVYKTDNIYTIYDIFLYPQRVTAATVSGDDTLYPKWITELSDEVFNDMRFQGHSHVNMGTTPSGVDANFYEDILKTLDEGDYYIFCIANKKGDLNIWLYDFAQNVIFDKKDIQVQIILEDDSDLDNWFKTEKEKILETPKTDIPANVAASAYYKRLENKYNLNYNYGGNLGYYDSADDYSRYNYLNPKPSNKGGKKNESK